MITSVKMTVSATKTSVLRVQSEGMVVQMESYTFLGLERIPMGSLCCLHLEDCLGSVCTLLEECMDL